MIEKFLRHVLAEQGFYCLATPTEYGYGHKVVDTIEKLVELAGISDTRKTDTFFAVGTLKESKVWDTKKKDYKTGEPGAWAIRTHANMNQFKSLILDLDCNQAKKKYEYFDQQEAITALKSFVNSSGMPLPTVVNSGRGIHAYFTFEESVDADTWYDLSVKASLVYSHYGLKVDPSRVKDKSSVLRVAGTHHYKDPSNPKEVTVIRYGEHTPVEKIETILDKIIAFSNLKVPEKTIVNNELAGLFSGVASNLETQKPINLDLVFSKCNQMAYIKEMGGPSGYALRCSAISIMKLSADPDYSILLKDDPDPEVVQSQTDMALADSITENPHTCERFEAAHEGGCRGCEHIGKVKSPAVLGRAKRIADVQPTQNIEEFTKPEQVIVVEQSETIEGEVVCIEKQEFWEKEAPPTPYAVNYNGVYVTTPSEFGGDTLEQVYEYPFYPYERTWDIRLNEEVVKAVVHLPHDGERHLLIPTEALADSRTLSKILAKNGVITENSDKNLILAGYMSNYIRELQKRSKSTTNYAQLGWQEDSSKFVLPESTINAEGEIEECGVSATLRATSKNFHKKGDIEAWKEVINTYAAPGYEQYAFGHLVGYGSLLFNFTQYGGAIVNMMGDSGSGKTTVLHTINSIFGHPIDMLSIQDDTYMSKMERVGIYNSISSTYDEITDIPKEDLGKLCYNISQGRAKDRLTQGAVMKENNTRWKMIMSCTSNKSLFDILGSDGFNNTGKAMRVFEFRVDCKNVMSLTDSQKIFGKLFDNYGHAGEMFVKYVMTHKERIKQLMLDTNSKFEKAAQVQIPERYWVEIASCCIVGGIIAKELGLNTFNIDNLFDWTVEQIKNMRIMVGEVKRDAKSILVEFMNTHIGATIVVRGSGVKGDPHYIPDGGEPHNQLIIRNEIDFGVAYIAKNSIKAFIQKNGADYTAIKKELLASGILLDDDKPKVLSQHSTTARSGQVHCWLVSTSHQQMAGAQLSIVKSISKDTKSEFNFGE